MSGSVFKRCTRCGATVKQRRCGKCGSDSVRWAFIVDVGRDANGRRVQRKRSGFDGRKQAEQALRGILSSLDERRYIAPSAVTLADYLLEDWLPSRKPNRRGAGRGHRGQLGIGTWSTYLRDVQAHVIPRLGGVKLQDLTPALLNKFYDEMEEHGGRRGQGLSPKSVVNLHGILHKALQDAVKRGLLTRNVADAVEAPKASRPRTSVWSIEQLRVFLAHVSDDRLYAAWLLFATTGMRRGEVAGLAWPDVDLDAGKVRIEKALGVVDNKPTWKERPKSDAGERVMALDPATVQALRAYRALQAEDRLRLGPAWSRRVEDWRGEYRDDLVFTRPSGALIRPNRWTVWFAQHCEAVGLPRIRLHDLRHTYATAALASATGWHEVNVISKRLGHASIGITIDTYAHVLPRDDQQTADTLARLILGEPADESGS